MKMHNYTGSNFPAAGLSVIKLWLVKGARQGVSGEGRQYSIHFIFVTFPKVTLVRGCIITLIEIFQLLG